MVWKLFLRSSLRKSYFIWRENYDMVKFLPFKTKIRPFFGQNWQFWEFLTYNFQTPPWIFLIFGMEFVLMVFFEKIILYMLENSDMAKFGPFKAFFGQNWQFWPFLAFNFQTPPWIFLIFGMEVVLMVLFEKIILYMPGKFWYGGILAI